MARQKGILKEEFQLDRYVKSPSQRHEIKKTSFHFQDNLIQKLPFIKDKSIDLYDLTNHVRRFSLVLRLGKKSKTFYIKQDQRAMRKLGRWIEPNNNTHIKPPTGYLTTAMARAMFKQQAKELAFVAPEKAHFREWTIEEYLQEQYAKDRLVYPNKRNEVKPIADLALKAIKRDIAPLLELKIRELNIGWLGKLEKYWSQSTTNPVSGVTKVRSVDTNRKSFTQINAMFNLWVKAGYVAKNPLEGQISRFRNKQDQNNEILIFEDLSIEKTLSYLFSEEVKCAMAAKLVLATMIVAGVRNSEAYRNFRENFDIERRELLVPETISLKTGKKRIIHIESNLYWQKVKEYLASGEFFDNEYGHMFPSHKKSRTGHIANTCTREPWKAIKHHFRLHKDSRAYTFRHTYASKLANVATLEIAAAQIGDSLETTYKYYLKTDKEAVKKAASTIQNDASSLRAQTSQDNSTQIDDLVAVYVDDMPQPVRQKFSAFASGNIGFSNNQIPLQQWNTFVIKLRELNDKKPNDEIEDWLFFQ
ncbi:site-specific integrase [Vibrio vulnificus]|uniref:site-specific integrase n=1 Tax=Vibrio vulnificus TaxID=672 RepID=UPI001028B4E5|nr:site-specific integrase [Vibrio vulnificus]ELI0610105.1 site-specific integrase [Vibrio vulnificus]MCU8272680.1 site-specific integrase [Vibrio vulnificus]RZQ16864.1 site-specific integrase [Vibrio vulnificus]